MLSAVLKKKISKSYLHGLSISIFKKNESNSLFAIDKCWQ